MAWPSSCGASDSITRAGGRALRALTLGGGGAPGATAGGSGGATSAASRPPKARLVTSGRGGIRPPEERPHALTSFFMDEQTRQTLMRNTELRCA